MREFSALSITKIAIKSNKGKLDVHRKDIVAGVTDLKMRI